MITNIMIIIMITIIVFVMIITVDQRGSFCRRSHKHKGPRAIEGSGGQRYLTLSMRPVTTLPACAAAGAVMASEWRAIVHSIPNFSSRDINANTRMLDQGSCSTGHI